MPVRLWPTGLVGRVGLVLFATVALELLGSATLFEQAEILQGEESQIRRLADELASAVRVLALTPLANRPAVARELSETTLALDWRRRSEALPPPDSRADALRHRIVAAEPALAALHLAQVGDGVTGNLPLPDGSSLDFRTHSRSAVPVYLTELWSIGLLSGGVLLAALLVVRTLAAPLRMLVTAADAIGHGPAVALEEEGPREVRRVAIAFNAMQARIAKLVADRTQALAAVSHDLRTPIGRMRLRAGFLPPGDERTAFEADLGEMEAMLADLFAFLGGEADPEAPRRTDIAATLSTLVDDAADAGRDATYVGPDQFVVTVRALAVKRAFSNLLNNALTYGDRAVVTLRAVVPDVVVTVDDDGSGIPAHELAAVFAPFYRLDASRGREKGGMGLGLAIAKAAIEREGGTIALANRTAGGLRASVTLPAA